MTLDTDVAPYTDAELDRIELARVNRAWRKTVARLAEWAQEYHLSDIQFIVKEGTPLHRPAIAICAEIRNAAWLPDTISLEELRSEAHAHGWKERKPRTERK